MNLYASETLRDAFDLYTREQNAGLPDGEVVAAVALSPALQSRMERLLTHRKRGIYTLFGTAGRRVASILIAMLVALTTVTVSVEAVREKVGQFFAQILVFDTHTEISFPHKTPDLSEEVTFKKHTPAYIPNGYAVTDTSETSVSHDVLYTNAEENRIRFSQMRKNGATLQIDTEGVTYTEITVNGREGIAYTNKGTARVFLWDDAYVYTFSSAKVDQTELIKMAESLPQE